MDAKHIVSSLWNGIVGWVRQESAAATALVQAFIALGIAFAWWHWSNAQTGAVIGIVAALLGMFVRSQVTPIVRPRGARRGPVAEAVPQSAARQTAHAAGLPPPPPPPPPNLAMQQNPPPPPYPAPQNPVPQNPVPQNPTLPQERPPAGPAGEPPATPPDW
jgi:hypothetical protein